MSRLQLILFPTDFSDGSAAACSMLRTLATLSGARVHVLHVITELTDRRRRYLPIELVEQFIAEIRKLADDDMAQHVAQHLQGLDIATEIVIGDGYEDILRRATELGADLIVLGTHGKRGLERLLVGSTAEKVMRHSAIPVLTVRG
ncbi:MAG: universal stress protein [Rubrivivax sp.]|nr:universal stress protein [Rubrivivax sp.]